VGGCVGLVFGFGAGGGESYRFLMFRARAGFGDERLRRESWGVELMDFDDCNSRMQQFNDLSRYFKDIPR
jgi:hypothetical protein